MSGLQAGSRGAHLFWSWLCALRSGTGFSHGFVGAFVRQFTGADFVGRRSTQVLRHGSACDGSPSPTHWRDGV